MTHVVAAALLAARPAAGGAPPVVYKGQLTGGGANTTNPTIASGSVAVAIGDLIFAVSCGQGGTITCTAATDNLGNAYTAQNAGTVQGGVTPAIAFYSIATVAGTLTAVNFADTASANDCAVIANVYGGPFVAIDVNTANRTDNSSIYASTASGVLNFAPALAVAWLAGTSGGDTFALDTSAGWASPGGVISGGLRRVAGAHLDVADTATVTAGWTGAATGGNCVLGLATFRRA